MPFLAKMPCYMLHAWLPKAHVEASTVGRIVLAGRVMKLGRYGALMVGPVGPLRSLTPPVITSGVL